MTSLFHPVDCINISNITDGSSLTACEMRMRGGAPMAFDVRIWETFQVASQNMGNSDGWMGLSRPWTWGNLNF